MVSVTPPPQLRLPDALRRDPEVQNYFRNLDRILLQLWQKTGGANDDIAENPMAIDNSIQILALKSRLNEMSGGIEAFQHNTHAITLDDVYQRLEALERGVGVAVSLDDIYKRINAIEAQL